MPSDIDFCAAAGLPHLITVVAARRSDDLRLLVLDLAATRFTDSQGVRLLRRDAPVYDNLAEALREESRDGGERDRGLG